MFESYPLRTRRLSFALIAAILTCGHGIATGQEALKSGPQMGARLPGGFSALNVTNAELPGYAGKKNDFTEQHGQNATILVFAREVTDSVTSLIKKLDETVGKNKSARLRAVVVVVSDDEGVERTLKDLAERQDVRNVSLAVAGPPGPQHYRLSREAAVTVLMYRRLKVEANHAFRKGELNDMATEKILADALKLVADRR